MPELPDVEGFREVLASCAQGKRIKRVDVRDAGVLHGVSAARLSPIWKATGSPRRSGTASGCSPATTGPPCCCTSV